MGKLTVWFENLSNSLWDREVCLLLQTMLGCFIHLKHSNIKLNSEIYVALSIWDKRLFTVSHRRMRTLRLVKFELLKVIKFTSVISFPLIHCEKIKSNSLTNLSKVPQLKMSLLTIEFLCYNQLTLLIICHFASQCFWFIVWLFLVTLIDH